MEFIKIVGTALLSVAALFITTKLMGHKQVAQLDFFDYVSGITIGSIGAEMATELERPHIFIIALGVYGFASLLLNKTAQKLSKTRKYINGAPSILLSGGKLYRENLKKAKLDLSEFMLLCREQGYFDLRDVAVAVFEYNGKLSILPKAESRPLCPGDVKIPVEEAHVGTELVMDGRIMGENLKRAGKDEIWLEKRLRELGGKHPSDIFLAIYHEITDELEIYKGD
jgi:uncharacterized membrane protein YcaP (DUF421 family)